MKLLPILLFFSFLVSRDLWGASCCGAGGSFPGIITGESFLQTSVLFSYQNRYAEANSSGQYSMRPSSVEETLKTIAVRTGYALNADWQVGIEIPMVSHAFSQSLTTESIASFGDTTIHSAFKFLPEYEYSIWKPKGFLFLQMQFPTGGSRFNSSYNFSVDANGQGFYNTSLGLLLVKEIHFFDFFLSPKITYFFPREFTVGTRAVEHIPGMGKSILSGIGVSFFKTKLRLGISFSYAADPSVRVEALDYSTLPSESLALQSSLSFMFLDEWSTQISYSNSGWLSGNKNISLAENFSIQLQKVFF